ncbi:MAG: hypothetical protein QXX17_04320 [Conexivisphaerales archaeon]
MNAVKTLLVGVNAAVSLAMIAEGAVHIASFILLGIATLVLAAVSFFSSGNIGRLFYCGSSAMLSAAFAVIAYAASVDSTLYSGQTYFLIEVAGIAGALVFILLSLIACSAAW